MTDIETALTDSVARDGQSPFTADQSMGNNKLTNVAVATAKTDAMSLANQQAQTAVYSATVGGTVDAITLTPSPALTGYAAGNKFFFIASGANTGATTVNVSGLGVKSITKRGSTALAAGDIVSGAMIGIQYDGTRFQMITPIGAALGDMATQNKASVNIDGGTIDGVTIDTLAAALDIDDGGTGATDAATAFSNLKQAASDSATGVVELATDAEVETGTSTTLVPSVASMRNGGLVLGTYTATTSGTSATFSSIPSWVKKFTIFISGVSTSGTSGFTIRLGDSGGIETSGYVGTVDAVLTAVGQAIDTLSSGFTLDTSSITNLAADVRHGSFTFWLVDSATNRWSCRGGVGMSNRALKYSIHGEKPLSAALDRVQITTVGGSDTLDAGNWQIVYNG